MNEQHIGYLIDVDFDRGGAPISTKILAEEIKKYFEVSVIKPYNPQEGIQQFEVIPIRGSTDRVPYMLLHPIKWLRMCCRLDEIIRTSNFQILHAHMPNVGMALGLLRMTGRIGTETRLVYTDREHVACLRWIHKIRYKFFIGRQFDAVVTLSETSLNYWRNTVRTATVCKIYNTASDEFENYDFKKMHFSPLRVIMVGRIVSDKGWSLAVDIVKKAPQYQYTLVMSYFDEEQRKEADILIKDVKDYPNVTVHFNLALKDVKMLYRQQDILVMTSERESFGRTAVEAMSQGCAVIGTRVGGLPEVIGKPENCLLRNVEAFCDRLYYYANNADDLEMDKHFFYEKYIENFSMSKNIERHKALYLSLID